MNAAAERACRDRRCSQWQKIFFEKLLEIYSLRFVKRASESYLSAFSAHCFGLLRSLGSHGAWLGELKIGMRRCASLHRLGFIFSATWRIC